MNKLMEVSSINLPGWMLVPKVWLPQAHAKKGTKGSLGEPFQPKMSKNENSIFVFQNFFYFSSSKFLVIVIEKWMCLCMRVREIMKYYKEGRC